jgi:hypothetical protein
MFKFLNFKDIDWKDAPRGYYHARDYLAKYVMIGYQVEVRISYSSIKILHVK